MKSLPTAIYLLKKLLRMLLTVLLVTTIIFFLVRLMPSNPIDRYVEDQMVLYGISYTEARNRAATLFSF